MTIKIEIPTILRPLVNGMNNVTADGSTIRDTIAYLEDSFPGLKERIVSNGNVHRYLNIYVNDEDIRFRDELDTPVRSGDVVTILPAVAGGGWRPVATTGARGR